MNFVIHDGYGEKYRVDLVEELPDCAFSVWHDSAQVAEANATVTGPLLLLKQIRVFDSVLYAEKHFVLWLRRMGHCPQKPNNYRTRGIGSALLSLIVDWAKERTLAGIVGDLSPDDLANNAHLLSWFIHRGFKFVEGGRFGMGQVIRTLSPRFSEPLISDVRTKQELNLQSGPVIGPLQRKPPGWVLRAGANSGN